MVTEVGGSGGAKAARPGLGVLLRRRLAGPGLGVGHFPPFGAKRRGSADGEGAADGILTRPGRARPRPGGTFRAPRREAATPPAAYSTAQPLAAGGSAKQTGAPLQGHALPTR